MATILERLARNETLLADGAMGTQLFARGLEAGACPELWNAENPEALADIARTYADAGANIILTNTFGGSSIRLGHYNLSDRTAELNSAAVKIARSSVTEDKFIAASIGPSGGMLEPLGDLSVDELRDSFTEQISAVIDAGADMIAVETMTDIAEATIAVKAARGLSSSIPISATMTFDKTANGFFTIMGVSVKQAAEELAKAGANIVGSNCGNGMELMIEIAQEFKTVTDLPLLIQANAGLPETEDGKLVYRETPTMMAEGTALLIESGVSIIGGCCGTTPAHIEAMRLKIDSQ
jgi:5-methyltetrahydrofolate--homocysteine methyltransferase